MSGRTPRRSCSPAAEGERVPTPALQLRVQNRHRAWPVNLRWLRQIAQAACAEVRAPGSGSRGLAGGELGVVLVHARDMARLNERFLGHAGPTDVISFDYREASAGDGGDRLRGELLVCLEEAARQAAIWGTTWPAEVVRYLVHGLLHLCGYDDREPEERRRMKREENRIVRRLASRFPFNRLETAGNVRP